MFWIWPLTSRYVQSGVRLRGERIRKDLHNVLRHHLLVEIEPNDMVRSAVERQKLITYAFIDCLRHPGDCELVDPCTILLKNDTELAQAHKMHYRSKTEPVISQRITHSPGETRAVPLLWPFDCFGKHEFLFNKYSTILEGTVWKTTRSAVFEWLGGS